MKKLMILATSLFIAASAAAAPTDCSPTQLIREHVHWLAAAKNNVVRVAAVSNQNNRLVSFAEGDLTITGQAFPGTNAPTYLGGTLEQFFSDRKYTLGEGGGVAVSRFPFSPKATDKISLSIASTGSISLALKSWNNTVIKLTDVRCSAGLLYGFTDTEPRSLYVISMSKTTTATPVLVK
jgi:hypothetical protein